MIGKSKSIGIPIVRQRMIMSMPVEFFIVLMVFVAVAIIGLLYAGVAKGDAGKIFSALKFLFS